MRSEIIPDGPDFRYYLYLVLIYFATRIIYKKKHNADCDKVNTYITHNHNEVISEVLTTRISGVLISVFQYVNIHSKVEKCQR